MIQFIDERRETLDPRTLVLIMGFPALPRLTARAAARCQTFASAVVFVRRRSGNWSEAAAEIKGNLIKFNLRWIGGCSQK